MHVRAHESGVQPLEKLRGVGVSKAMVDKLYADLKHHDARRAAYPPALHPVLEVLEAIYHFQQVSVCSCLVPQTLARCSCRACWSCPVLVQLARQPLRLPLSWTACQES